MRSVVASAPQAIAEIASGRPVVVVDEALRQNAGDVVLAAEFATPEQVNFMAMHARGLISLALDREGCERLDLTAQPRRSERFSDTAFMNSIEAREGVTTGISAHDRARTIAVALDPESGPEDLVEPGHVFPLRARDGGVLVRGGHTEAAVDLARLAGLRPGGVLCGVLNDDGSVARPRELHRFCSLHGLSMLSVGQLQEHRRKTELGPGAGEGPEAAASKRSWLELTV